MGTTTKEQLSILYRRKVGDTMWAKWRAIPTDEAHRVLQRPHPGYELRTEGARAK